MKCFQFVFRQHLKNIIYYMKCFQLVFRQHFQNNGPNVGKMLSVTLGNWNLFVSFQGSENVLYRLALNKIKMFRKQCVPTGHRLHPDHQRCLRTMTGCLRTNRVASEPRTEKDFAGSTRTKYASFNMVTQVRPSNHFMTLMFIIQMKCLPIMKSHYKNLEF